MKIIHFGYLHAVFEYSRMQGGISKICWMDSGISYQRKNIENPKVT